LGIANQFLGDESSIHLLWWVVVLKYLEVFCYFLTLASSHRWAPPNAFVDWTVRQ
jgi:hypothetical protein